MSLVIGLLSVALLVDPSPDAAASPGLTLERRIEAQRAIERVYHAHQLGAVEPFAGAVTRESLERKVRAYLAQSVALERVWNAPVTAEDLHGELLRIARRTRFPERLAEIFAALDHDPLLIHECLARPSLVGRLSRARFAGDPRIHAGSRAAAEELRERLARDPLVSLAPGVGRVDYEAVSSTADEPAVETDGVIRLTLAPEVHAKLSDDLPPRPGDVGEIVDTGDAFVLRQLLDRSERGLRFAEYRVPKDTWETWWDATLRDVDVSSVRPPEGVSRLPLPVVRQSTTIASVCDGWDNHGLDRTPQNGAGHSVIWTGNLMLVFGGSLGHAGWRYDPLLDAWSPMARPEFLADQDFNPSYRPVREQTAVWTGTQMIVWGNTTSSTGGRYDPATDTWHSTSLVGAPSPREQHTAVWTGTEMIVWGGRAIPSHLDLGDGFAYDPDQDTWTPITGAGAPSARQGHTAVWSGSEMIVWGGTTQNVRQDTGARYDPAANLWTALPVEDAPEARTHHAAVWTGDEMIVWGGLAGFTGLDSGGRYDPGTDGWMPTSTIDAPEGRFSNSVVWTGSEMIVWGGYPCIVSGCGPLATGARYRPDRDTWEALPLADAPGARAGHTAVWTDSEMIVWGGAGSSGPTNTGARFDPAHETWTATGTGAPAPAARTKGHTAVWTGNEMIVWGGYTAGGPSGGLAGPAGRYDPLLDSWAPLSPPGFDVATVGHTATWTGQAMLVVGGSASGRYDPLSDTWAPISSSGAPASYGSAVWTGEKLIVWGGEPGGSCEAGTNVGAVYDPVTDVWTPMSTTGAPTGRIGHSAVWSGTEMIVWGGYRTYYDNPPNLICFTQVFDDGRRYDPSTNHWMSLQQSGAPSGRVGHTAVWTGDEMIVWGGSSCPTGTACTGLDTGARYDPQASGWTPTSTVGAPEGRVRHTAVWTGDEMIVWGGMTGVDEDAERLDSGARYDPSTDTWTATPAADVPLARSAHTAVWTGGEMIVWGGQFLPGYSAGSSSGFTALSDGGSHRPFLLPDDVGELVVEHPSPPVVRLAWDAAPAATSYTVFRGVAGAVGDGQYGECLEQGIEQAWYEDPDLPAAGEAFTYLVRADNGCGAGPLGYDSNGELRLADPDPCLP